MRSSKPITVTLGRQEAALDEILRRKVEASLADPRPSIPAEKVFARLRAHHAKQVKRTKRS